MTGDGWFGKTYRLLSLVHCLIDAESNHERNSMGNLILSGKLNLMGKLALKDKLLIKNGQGQIKEALVELSAPADKPHSSTAPSVIMPPPPATPVDTGTKVWIINSFNKMVTVGTKAIVTMGVAMQGGQPTWPGMALTSSANPPPNGVTINMLAVNVVGDKVIIFPSGASVSLDSSGQE